MDLGNKTLNNLTSKDEKLAQNAAYDLVMGMDTQAFEILCAKSDLIFDFVKEKILKRLSNAVNKENVLNLFGFMKVFSSDFSDFILLSFKKFQNEEIVCRLKGLLYRGSAAEKTYAVLFFCLIGDENVVQYAKTFIKSEFEPLKISSIKALATFGQKDEYNNSISILKGLNDDIEKLEAVDFLVNYDDKAAFEPVFEYFLKSGEQEIVASNLLCLKSLQELIFENKENEVLKILSSILRAYPDEILYSEVEAAFSDEVFEFLAEVENNLAPVLVFYLSHKINSVLANDIYSMDLIKGEKESAMALIKKSEIILSCYDKNEIFKSVLASLDKTAILPVLDMIDDKDFMQDIKNLAQNSSDDEIILFCAKTLKKIGIDDNNTFLELSNRAQNETVKAEIKSLCV